MTRNMKRGWWLGLIALTLCLPAGHAQGLIEEEPVLNCEVVDGEFRRVWGGLNQNAFVLHPFNNVAWTVEDGARIRFTNNGGNTWTEQKTPACTQDVLRSAHFLHDGPVRTGWAVGDGGAVLKTTNGGQKWTRIATINAMGQPAELWDIFFLDADNGYLAGNHVLKYSTDGGDTWTDITANHPNDPTFDFKDAEYYSVDFIKTPSGYVGVTAAEPGLILRTDQSTAGTVWDVTYDYCFAPPLCSQCAPPVADCKEEPGFELWDVEIGPDFADESQIEMFVSGGFGNQCGQFLISSDSGQSWGQEFVRNGMCNMHANAPCKGNGNLDGVPTQYGVHAMEDAQGISVGYGGTVYVRDTTCDPAIWRKKSPITGAPNGNFTQPFFGVDGNQRGTAWITAMFNGLFKSTDAGQTWAAQSVGNNVYRTQGVHFADANEGWHVGQFFRIAKTVDGGVNWTDQPFIQGGGNLNDIVFADNAQDGVAVGNYYDGSGNFEIQFTTDGGASWARPSALPVTPGSNRSLMDVVHTAGTQFWAAGNNGLVLYSADGGDTWSEVPIDLGAGQITSVENYAIAFSDPDTAYVSGTDAGVGTIYKLTNATNPALRQWSPVSPPQADGVIALPSIDADATRVYAVGKKQGAQTERGVVYAWDGSAFVEQSVPVPSCFTYGTATKAVYKAVALAPGSSDVLVAGSCGRVIRYDGTEWTELKSDTSFPINDISLYAADGGFIHALGTGHMVLLAYDPTP